MHRIYVSHTLGKGFEWYWVSGRSRQALLLVLWAAEPCQGPTPSISVPRCLNFMSGGSLKPHQPPSASGSPTRESRAGHWVRCRGIRVVPLLCHPLGARSCPVLWLQPVVLRVTFPVHTWLAEGIPACSTLLWFRVSTEVEKKKGKKKSGNGKWEHRAIVVLANV